MVKDRNCGEGNLEKSKSRSNTRALGKPRTELPGGHGGTGLADSFQDSLFDSWRNNALSLARRLQDSKFSSPAMTERPCRRSADS